MYNPFLLNELNESFEGAVRKEVPAGLQKTSNEYRNPFEHLSTESKCLQVDTKAGQYKKPLICPIAGVTVSKLTDTNLDLRTDDVPIVRFPVAEGLQRLFEMDGLFEATLDHYEFLRANKYSEFLSGRTMGLNM
ncbi:hypothetical protein QAD02_020389 [Eretmocerus hayati]|uniref:Uncharacterized protein n=1 Tax=Eretmocerus hayati TaxID=131215 RepID=A0ACC2PQH0_9HYME|nr:hypothetical protein QAD02_020389 [Eretmocerus hayati]